MSDETKRVYLVTSGGDGADDLGVVVAAFSSRALAEAFVAPAKTSPDADPYPFAIHEQAVDVRSPLVGYFEARLEDDGRPAHQWCDWTEGEIVPPSKVGHEYMPDRRVFVGYGRTPDEATAAANALRRATLTALLGTL